MGTTLIALLALSGAALYFMTAEERVRLAREAIARLRAALQAAIHSAESGEPFDEFLRARTSTAVVTPVLVGLNALVFILMMLGSGSFGEPRTMIEWGANYAPRTTNGEWWRFLAATFVHGGLLHFAASIAGLVPLGIVLERAVGRVAFAAIYFAAGIVASVTSLWTISPMSVSYGASGAVFGIYGLLLAASTWTFLSRPEGPLPLILMKRIGAAAVPFLLYNLFTDHLGIASEMAGLGIGFAGGLFITRDVMIEKPPLPRAAMVMAASMVIAIAAAFPLRGIIDVRPEMAGVIAVEERTAGAYDAAVVKFRLGVLPAKALVQLIDRTIIPDLTAVRTRLHGLRGVPSEQRPLVTAAEEYFRLREQSWRDRAEALVRSKMEMFRKADETERAALAAFRKIRPEQIETAATGS